MLNHYFVGIYFFFKNLFLKKKKKAFFFFCFFFFYKFFFFFFFFFFFCTEKKMMDNNASTGNPSKKETPHIKRRITQACILCRKKKVNRYITTAERFFANRCDCVILD
jgi:hypothetical protein